MPKKIGRIFSGAKSKIFGSSPSSSPSSPSSSSPSSSSAKKSFRSSTSAKSTSATSSHRKKRDYDEDDDRQPIISSAATSATAADADADEDLNLSQIAATTPTNKYDNLSAKSAKSGSSGSINTGGGGWDSKSGKRPVTTTTATAKSGEMNQRNEFEIERSAADGAEDLNLDSLGYETDNKSAANNNNNKRQKVIGGAAKTRTGTTRFGAAAVAAEAEDTESNDSFGAKFWRLFRRGPTLTSATGYDELSGEQQQQQQHQQKNDTNQRSSSSIWRWCGGGSIFGRKSTTTTTTTTTLTASRRPTLFGAFDGVYITCVVHLFGVISFLRIGWLVANEGMLLAAAIVFGCLLFTTISLLAAIGIMQRCAAVSAATSGSNFWIGNTASVPSSNRDHNNENEDDGDDRDDDDDGEYSTSVAQARANVHLLISTVLGSRIGGAISLIYCFGQSVSCALHVTGFTETFVQLVEYFFKAHPWDPTRANIADQSTAMTRFAQLLARLLFIEVESRKSAINSTASEQQRHRISSTNSETNSIGLIQRQIAGLAQSVASSSSSSSIYRTLPLFGPHLDSAIEQRSSPSSLSSSSSPASPGGDTSEIFFIITDRTYQTISIVTIGVLFVINLFGVKWLFRLQSLLFVSLILAIIDLQAGLFVEHPVEPGSDRIIVNIEHVRENLYPQFAASSATFWARLFTVIGVFFPSAIGVMAGVNMGPDLRNPARSIPVGSLSAIGTSFVLHVLLIAGLGAACTRQTLLTDYAVGQHVSAFGWFFLTGVYMSAQSSSLGNMYTAPRILQNLAQELHSFAVLRCFAAGRGPNRTPINALILFTLVTLLFVMIGRINVLAPIVTIPYLLTYAAIEYAYFSMAMTFDIQIAREKRFMTIASRLRSPNGDDADDAYNADDYDNNDHQTGNNNNNANNADNRRKPADIVVQIAATDRSLGPKSPRVQAESAAAADTTSLLRINNNANNANNGNDNEDHSMIPPPSPTPSLQQHLMGYGSVQSMTQHIKIKRRQSTQSDSETGSDDDDGVGGADDEMSTFAGQRVAKSRHQATIQAAKNRAAATKSVPRTTPIPSSESSSSVQQQQKKTKKTIKQLMAAESDDDSDDDDDADDGQDHQDDHRRAKDEQEDGADQEINRMRSANTDSLHQTSVFRFETSEITKRGTLGTSTGNLKIYRNKKKSNNTNNNDDNHDDRSRSAKSIKKHDSDVDDDEENNDDDGDAKLQLDINRNHDNATPSDRLLNPDPELAEIACKQETWYLRIMNRWIVAFAALVKLAFMFCIAWHYAIAIIAAFAIFYLIIGKTNPGHYPGVSEFCLAQWLRNCAAAKLTWKKLRRNASGSSTANLVASYSYDRIVLPPASMPDFDYRTQELTAENSDFSARKPFHGSTTINTQID